MTSEVKITFFRENLSAITEDGNSKKVVAIKNEDQQTAIIMGLRPESYINAENIANIGENARKKSCNQKNATILYINLY